MEGSPYSGAAFYRLHVFVAIWLLYIIGKNADGCVNYSEDTKSDGLCAPNDDSQFNVNLNLQKQTRDVVMMQHLPRIDPVKVRQTIFMYL